ncbi:MAG: DUF4783 domain-containing protein [Chitinophagaceae bacterium]|nr:DUF4783 domain-containing protein [Chitinophagaceae bacterium]
MIFFTKLLLLITASLATSSYTASSEMDDIIAALKSGNASQLARYFDSRVDISLPAKSDNYSQRQAEMIMKDFFLQNAVKSFQLKHTGENKDGSQYCTGTLITKGGNYRTILFMKQKGDRQLLQQLSFQNTD